MMWEVIWTDPDRELVGERRARKESERERKRDKNDRKRASTSTGSSSSVGIAGGGGGDNKTFSLQRGLMRAISSPKPSKSAKKSNPVRPPTTPTEEPGLGGLHAGPGAASHKKPGIPAPTNQERGHQQPPPPQPFSTPTSASSTAPLSFLDSGETSPTSRDSIFSKWTDPASTFGGSVTESAKSSVMQTLGPSSFVSKSTEATVVPRPPEAGVDRLVTEVAMSPDGRTEEPPTPPLSPADISSDPPRPDTPVNLIPGPGHPSPPAWVSSFKPNNPDAWKPPEAWDVALPSHPFRGALRDAGHADPNWPTPEALRRLEVLQQDLRRMAGTSPRHVIERLGKVWSICANDGIAYRRMETEQKHWMLSALAHLDPVVQQNPWNPPTSKAGRARTKNVLALYETQATALYLAGLHYTKDVYHLSVSPVSSGTLPNVRPLMVPAVSASCLPVAPRLFGTVYSLALPALCSSSDIPSILRSVHRSLAPGGVLELTLIDPMPCPASLGPRMRAWLEEGLLINLERRFRCVSPSKLFPIWLGDALLRGEGSTITTARFAAVPPGTVSDPPAEDGPATEEKLARSELRTIVGRMLWVEVWGPFVEAGHWWWDDPACVEECRQMGTFWEYSLIEAVKEDDPSCPVQQPRT